MALFSPEEQKELSRSYLKWGCISIAALAVFFVVFIIYELLTYGN